MKFFLIKPMYRVDIAYEWFIEEFDDLTSAIQYTSLLLLEALDYGGFEHYIVEEKKVAQVLKYLYKHRRNFPIRYIRITKNFDIQTNGKTYFEEEYSLLSTAKVLTKIKNLLSKQKRELILMDITQKYDKSLRGRWNYWTTSKNSIIYNIIEDDMRIDVA